jgi:DNA repair protein RadC
MCDLTVEECHVLMLNNRNKVIDRIKVGSGGYTATVVDVRCIMREALLKRATSMIMCHNHPSGSLKPSREDDELTRNVASACKVMNIRFLDHIIFTDGNYYSYKDERGV